MTPKGARQSPRHIGRRRFISAVALAPLAWAVAAMLGRARARFRPSTTAIPAETPAGLSVCGTAIVNRAGAGDVHAFAARCTHLGCRLDRVVDHQIVCPCHGSRFAADGRVLAGPAIRPLDPMRVTPDAQTGGWLADVV